MARVEQEFQITGQPVVAGGTQAVDRSATLLRLVLESAQPLGVGDLAREAHLPKSTASRLVSSLERHGLVRRSGSRGKILPGPVILRYAHQGAVERSLLDLADDHLRELAAASGEAVHLAVPGAGGVEFLAEVETEHFLGTGRWVGRTADFGVSALGRVFLAFGTATIDAAQMRALGPRLEEVRRDDSALAVDELEIGLAAVAAPVRGPTGDVIAAISISGPTLRLPPRRLTELRAILVTQARALSARLGYHHEGDRAA